MMNADLPRALADLRPAAPQFAFLGSLSPRHRSALFEDKRLIELFGGIRQLGSTHVFGMIC
jgi:hypothetical protein